MDPHPEPPSSSDEENEAFPKTRWSLVARLNGDDPSAARIALEELCGQYRFPLYCFARRLGLTHYDAEDVLHDFMEKFLRNGSFSRADANRGTMRAYLSGSLRFMIYDWLRERRDEPRDSPQVARRPDSSDGDDALERYENEVFVDNETPERIFERQWAIELIRAALDRTRETYEDRGRGDLFTTLRPFLLNGQNLRGLDLPALADSVGMTETNLRTSYSRLLDTYRANFRRQVLHTVESVNDVEGEIQHLMAVLARD